MTSHHMDIYKCFMFLHMEEYFLTDILLKNYSGYITPHKSLFSSLNFFQAQSHTQYLEVALKMFHIIQTPVLFSNLLF